MLSSAKSSEADEERLLASSVRVRDAGGDGDAGRECVCGWIVRSVVGLAISQYCFCGGESEGEKVQGNHEIDSYGQACEVCYFLTAVLRKKPRGSSLTAIGRQNHNQT